MDTIYIYHIYMHRTHWERKEIKQCAELHNVLDIDTSISACELNIARGSTDPGWSQTSYLSRISRIISVEKNLSCGEISDFCKEFEQFMEFYRNLCRFCSKFVWRKICVEKISVEKK